MNTARHSSLTAHVAPLMADNLIVSCAWLGRMPVFLQADGIALMAGIGEEERICLFEGAGLLCTATSRSHLVAGADNGQVISLDATGKCHVIADATGKWVDAIALSADGNCVAWSSARLVNCRDGKGSIKQYSAPSSVRGLAFMPKGYRLAISHYNGASLWFPNSVATTTEFYEWKGSHLDITISPDGRFIITSMQENTLHGWTVADKKHMRMSGYPSKTRSLDWSHDGNWLATSGADAAIVWPFQSKDGPMGKAPRECGIRPAKVTKVAFHPRALVVAIGYEDGFILLCRLTDASEILVRQAVEGSGITALAWDHSGAQLAFGAEDGAAGILTLPAA